MTHGDEGERVYHLALREQHESAGAHFDVRQGWSLPMDYGNWLNEHRAIRTGAALCDRSHRSRILVTGTDAPEVLAGVFAGHVDELEEGRAMRTLSLDERGFIRDLVLVARTGGISYLVTGEAPRRFDTLARLRGAVKDDFDAKVDDRTETTCWLSVTGPGSEALVRTQMAEELPSRLPSLHAALFVFHGFRTLALRSSDSGEDGFEMMLAPAVMQHALETLREAGGVMCGFQAQEAARIEACIPAFEPDLAEGLTPGQADLDGLLNIEPGAGGKLLSALMFDEGAAKMEVGWPVHREERVIGSLRSSTYSPLLDANIGLAVLDQVHGIPGTEVTVGGTRANVVGKPFLRRRTTT